MKIVGVDYGTKRTGLAWVDTTLDMALPYGVVQARAGVKKPAYAQMAEKVADILAQETVHLVVVGFPTDLQGQETRMTQEVKQFAFELGKRIAAQIEFFDERFTSKGALPSGPQGASADEQAAMAILAGYRQRHL